MNVPPLPHPINSDDKKCCDLYNKQIHVYYLSMR